MYFRNMPTVIHNTPFKNLFSVLLPCWPSVKASALRAEDPGFESRLHQDFSGVKSYQ